MGIGLFTIVVVAPMDKIIMIIVIGAECISQNKSTCQLCGKSGHVV